MNKIIELIVLFLLIDVPLANAYRCINATSIEASNWGQLEAAVDSAGIIITEGGKPVTHTIGIDSDAGEVGASFLLFKLPSFCAPVIFGKLQLKVRTAMRNIGPTAPPFLFVLYDVGDIPQLLKPVWDISDYINAKSDLSKGRIYGNFKVRHSPANDGMIIDIPLSYDSMYDINAAAGGLFAIGIAAGGSVAEGWSGEGDDVSFVTPEEGGLAQLELTMVGKSRGKQCYKKYGKKKY